jgi:hypothetical protein
MDLFVGARAAGGARIHITTAGCASTVASRHAICVRKEQANREIHEFGAPHTHGGLRRDTYSATQHNPVGHAEADCDPDAHINANAHTEADPDTYADTNSDTGSNANADSRAANVQPCVRDRDGERGVDQPDR